MQTSKGTIQVPRPTNARRGDKVIHIEDHAFTKGGIRPTDGLIFIETTKAEEGDLIAAETPETRAEHDAPLALGFLHRERGKLVLFGETPDEDSDFYKPEDVKIVGRLVGVLRDGQIVEENIKGARRLIHEREIVLPQGCDGRELLAVAMPESPRRLKGVKIPRTSLAVAAVMPVESGAFAAYKWSAEGEIGTSLGYYYEAANGYGIFHTLPRKGEPRVYVVTPDKAANLWRVMHIENRGKVLLNFPRPVGNFPMPPTDDGRTRYQPMEVPPTLDRRGLKCLSVYGIYANDMIMVALRDDYRTGDLVGILGTGGDGYLARYIGEPELFRLECACGDRDELEDGERILGRVAGVIRGGKYVDINVPLRPVQEPQTDAERFAYHLSEAMRIGAECDDVPASLYNALEQTYELIVMDEIEEYAPETILFVMAQAKGGAK